MILINFIHKKEELVNYGYREQFFIIFGLKYNKKIKNVCYNFQQAVMNIKNMKNIIN